jgi:DNA-repair protein XRCC3
MRGLTEIAGEAGAGKTQLCLQLALHAVLPKEHGGLGGK